jgi:hypothetical protein
MPSKLGPKEYGIIGAAVLAVALAIFIVSKGMMADRPNIINNPPQNVVGTSEKSREMAKQNAVNADSKAQVAPPGGGGGSPGDDVQPPPAPPK